MIGQLPDVGLNPGDVLHQHDTQATSVLSPAQETFHQLLNHGEARAGVWHNGQD